MDKQYVNDEHLQIAMTEYNPNNSEIGHIVQTEQNKTVGYIGQVYDNTSGDGEQVYAVVKNPDERPEDVQEVTVLFRGSTGPNKIREETADVFNDWGGNDLPIGTNLTLRGIHDTYSQTDESTGQLKASASALKDIMETYPNAKINVYGHSLGSMDAQYAMAALDENQVERIQQAYVYNGPDVYRILSPEQRGVVDKIKTRIHNYADPRDYLISMAGRRQYSNGSIGSVGLVHFVASKEQDFTDQHMTYGYQLDRFGQIRLISNPTTEPLNNFLIKMESFKTIKNTLASGGYSTNEKIFLDSEQASSAASSISDIVKTEVDNIKVFKDARVGLAKDVHASLKVPPAHYILTPSEVESAYAEAGLTYSTTVGELENLINPVLDKVTQLESTFTSLETQIKDGIQKKLDDDKELAADFNLWEAMQML